MPRLRLDHDRREGARAGLSARSATLAFVATLFVALIPLWFAAYPPLHDYPFHLARVDVLARWHASPELQHWYDLRSFLIPNIGVDVVTVLLARIVPVAVAGRLVIALTFAALFGGTVALHRMLFGRCALWPLVSAALLFNWILLYGFLNYLLGIGVLLWATAAWIALRESTPFRRCATGACFAVVLFFCHFVSLVLFAIVVAGYQLTRAADVVRTNVRGAAREIATGAAIFVVPLGLFLLSPTAGQAGSTIAYAHPLVASKLLAVWRSCMAGHWVLDATLTGAVIAGLLLVQLGGDWRVDRSMRGVLVLLALTFAVMPERLFNARHIDLRLPVAIVFLAIGAVDPVIRSRRTARLAAFAAAALIVSRSVFLCYAWHEYDSVIRRFTSSFESVPDGAILFVASTAPIPTLADVDLSLWQPPLKHVASLASIGRPVFVPATWAHSGQQPIKVTERFRPMYEFQAQNPIRVENQKILGFLVGRIRRLAAETGEQPPAPLYLLLLYPRLLGPDPPAHTEVKVSDPLFTLLAINPPAQP